MKKMKFAALFAAFVSVFGFTSCLDDGDSTQQYQSLVTVESSYMGYTTLYADEFPNQALIPTNADLTQFGITASTKRAMIVYTVPEGQEATEQQARITVTQGQYWPVYDISYRPDTCANYNSPITGFSDYSIMWTFKSGFIARDRFLNLGFKYKPYSKVASTVLLPNRVSNDTLYLDFKMKKDETQEGQERIFMNTYDLHSCAMELHKLTPKNDSMYVTVVSEVSSDFTNSYVKKDSVTNRCKYIY